jgi:23S rRNA pseudouridine1911/1915/1917 synthase
MEERLDKRLARMFPALPRSEIESAIREGRVRVGGRRVAKGCKVGSGDVVEVGDLEELAEKAAAGLRGDPSLPLEVLWEDGDFVAVNKPSGMPVQPLRWGESGTLVHALLARWPEMGGIGPDPLCPAVLHRIDVWTSGVVLAAKNEAAWRCVREQFAARSVEKIYWAIVEGRVGAGRSNAPLVRQTRTPCRMRALAPGEALPRHGDVFPAETAWIPLRTGPHCTLLEVTIKSGVTHQIRCHLAAAGHPLLGDTLYGAPAHPAGHHFLHARSISWRSPAGAELRAVALPPHEFLVDGMSVN